MGFLGGGNDSGHADDEINQQIQDNKAELEAKKQSLYQTRLDIIKGQGAESFTPSIGGAQKINPSIGLGKKS